MFTTQAQKGLGLGLGYRPWHHLRPHAIAPSVPQGLPELLAQLRHSILFARQRRYHRIFSSIEQTSRHGIASLLLP
jgi:hypothetical protein